MSAVTPESGASLRSLAILFVLALVSCSEDASEIPGQRFQVWDSAGVRIVETLAPIREFEDGWTAALEPILVIRSPAVETGYLIFWMRGTVRLSDGRIAALSDGTKELLFFDSSGAFQQAVGREGDGPGEFRSPFQLIRLPGDTLLVRDRVNHRVSWFSPTGEYLNALVPDYQTLSEHVPGGYRFQGSTFYIPGGFLLRGVGVGINSIDEVPVGRISRQTVGFMVMPVGAEEAVFLGPFPGLERFYLETGLGRPAFFGAGPVITFRVNPVHIILGDSKTFDLREFSPDGQLLQIIRDAIPPDPIRPEDIEWERHDMVSFWQRYGGPERWNRLADAMPIPTLKPAFEELIVDSQGCLWVKEYSSHSPAPIRYRIYARDGIRLGAVRLPGSFRVTDIGRDYILGIGYDPDAVETVQMFQLIRPTRAGCTSEEHYGGRTEMEDDSM